MAAPKQRMFSSPSFLTNIFLKVPSLMITVDVMTSLPPDDSHLKGIYHCYQQIIRRQACLKLSCILSTCYSGSATQGCPSGCLLTYSICLCVAQHTYSYVKNQQPCRAIFSSLESRNLFEEMEAEMQMACLSETEESPGGGRFERRPERLWKALILDKPSDCLVNPLT